MSATDEKQLEFLARRVELIVSRLERETAARAAAEERAAVLEARLLELAGPGSSGAAGGGAGGEGDSVRALAAAAVELARLRSDATRGKATIVEQRAAIDRLAALNDRLIARIEAAAARGGATDGRMHIPMGGDGGMHIPVGGGRDAPPPAAASPVRASPLRDAGPTAAQARVNEAIAARERAAMRARLRQLSAVEGTLAVRGVRGNGGGAGERRGGNGGGWGARATVPAP